MTYEGKRFTWLTVLEAGSPDSTAGSREGPPAELHRGRGHHGGEHQSEKDHMQRQDGREMGRGQLCSFVITLSLNRSIPELH